LSLWQTRGDS